MQTSHEVDYQVIGHDMQLVEIELDPCETVVAEAGAMIYMDDGISFSTRMGDGSDPDQGLMGKLFSAGKRMVSGNTIFLGHFTNESSSKRSVSFGAPYPGKIVPIELSEVGGTITCQKDAFLCAAMGTRLDVAFQKRLGAGFFGGEGFILQHLQGDGRAFLHACGTIITRKLEGETLLVEAGSLVAFTEGVDYDIQRAGNMTSMLFGGEGLFLAKMSGHGTVMMQSLPFSRLANHILARAPHRD
ncbi:TIGR00266 family protein [Blastopirellula retiformator]|uniref:TIGR00266 family protein n=1 Tax=Blastopirellula retiformator TaxID=2527970 RepID=A0A5C5UZG2_9BACT|nr:TIGR00266 family protein [Blastopirellula retiformator]TWT31601.1 hypothetical protein Enr8_35230 [Blastopirellula retiformator]